MDVSESIKLESPIMAFKGVLNSCEMLAKNSDFSLSDSWALDKAS